MRTPTPFVVLSVALAGCVDAPAPELGPPPRAFGCVPIEQAIVGTWQREGATQEFRADGVYQRDGYEGAFRFRAPGRVVLDVARLHSEELVGLASVNELASADESGIGRTWTRVSPSPSIPANCYDAQSSVVGTWRGGPELQTFEADGRYTSGENVGGWHMASNGHLTIRAPMRGDETYVFVQLSDTSALMFATGERASLLTRVE